MPDLDTMIEVSISSNPLISEEWGMGQPCLVRIEGTTGDVTLESKRRDGNVWVTEATFDNTQSLQIVGAPFLLFRIRLTQAGGSFYYQRIAYPYTGRER